MKVKAKDLKTARTGYLYKDGHLVLCHEKHDRDAGRVEWVTIYENVGIRCDFDGRLVIGDGALPFVLHCTRIQAKEATLDRGSIASKERGIRVGSVSLFNGNQHYGFNITLMPDIISSDFTYQPDNDTTFEDVKKDPYTWGWHSIKEIHYEPIN